MREVLYHVTLPYATFGVVVWNGRVTESAPIARWMVGQSLAAVQRWVAKKRGRMEALPG